MVGMLNGLLHLDDLVDSWQTIESRKVTQTMLEFVTYSDSRIDGRIGHGNKDGMRTCSKPKGMTISAILVIAGGFLKAQVSMPS